MTSACRCNGCQHCEPCCCTTVRAPASGIDWRQMGRDQFDKRAGTARERRMAARLRNQPDTLLPELAEVQLSRRGKAPEIPEQLPGQFDLFGEE